MLRTVATPTYTPSIPYRMALSLSTRDSLLFLGGLCMIFWVMGLKERAVAGSPSVTRLTQSSWTGVRMSAPKTMTPMKTATTSPILLDIKYLRGRRGECEVAVIYLMNCLVFS